LQIHAQPCKGDHQSSFGSIPGKKSGYFPSLKEGPWRMSYLKLKEGKYEPPIPKLTVNKSNQVNY
jgi:hypothetical protein